MKTVYPNKKNEKLFKTGQLFVIVMSNRALETMTNEKHYHEKKKKRRKVPRKKTVLRRNQRNDQTNCLLINKRQFLKKKKGEYCRNLYQNMSKEKNKNKKLKKIHTAKYV